MSTRREVWITGAGLLSCLGEGLEANWSKMMADNPPTAHDEQTYAPYVVHPLAPVNFAQSKKGTKSFTVWFAGPLSIENFRGRFHFIPSNLQRFTAFPGGPGKDVPADPSLPDYKRDVQFTVNAAAQSCGRVESAAIWISGSACTSRARGK